MRAVPNDNLLSANLIICESILTESTGAKTAVRIVNFFAIPYAGNPLVRFFALSLLTCKGPDASLQVAKVEMVEITSGVIVAEAPEFQFLYGFVDGVEQGAFSLSTEFNVDTSKVRVPAPYQIRLKLNGVVVAQTLLMLRR